MSSLIRIRAGIPIALVSGAVVLVGCGSSSNSSGSAQTQTTAAKVDKERAKVLDRLDNSAKLLNAFNEKVPPELAQRARCIVAIPSMAKGGIIIGAQGGSGFASCKTATGWSAPGPVHVGGGSVGAQLGYQETDVLSIVTSDKAMEALAGGNFKVGADASATAGPVGTGKGAGTAVDTNADMLSYSRSKGLFAGAELNGATIKPDEDARKALYGGGQDLRSILGGRTNAPPDPQAHAFMNALSANYGDGRLTPK